MDSASRSAAGIKGRREAASPRPRLREGHGPGGPPAVTRAPWPRGRPGRSGPACLGFRSTGEVRGRHGRPRGPHTGTRTRGQPGAERGGRGDGGERAPRSVPALAYGAEGPVRVPPWNVAGGRVGSLPRAPPPPPPACSFRPSPRDLCTPGPGVQGAARESDWRPRAGGGSPVAGPPPQTRWLPAPQVSALLGLSAGTEKPRPDGGATRPGSCRGPRRSGFWRPTPRRRGPRSGTPLISPRRWRGASGRVASRRSGLWKAARGARLRAPPPQVARPPPAWGARPASPPGPGSPRSARPRPAASQAQGGVPSGAGARVPLGGGRVLLVPGEDRGGRQNGGCRVERSGRGAPAGMPLAGAQRPSAARGRGGGARAAARAQTARKAQSCPRPRLFPDGRGVRRARMCVRKARATRFARPRAARAAADVPSRTHRRTDRRGARP